ncbi:MAG: DUF4920 domain-containing protein [Myxococcota bacterium]
MKKLALITSLLAVAACDASKPAAEKSADAAAAKPAADKAAEAAPVAAKAEADANAEEKENGCIYAEGEKDEKDAEPGCPHGDEGEGALAQADDGHRGAKFTLTDAVPLAKAIESKPEGDVLVSGEVEAVCQKKGCWMVLKDGDVSARVLMKDHGFSVPMDSRGKKVQVEGTLTSRTFTEAQVKHLEKDGGGDPGKVSGTRTEHVLTASGVMIQS